MKCMLEVVKVRNMNSIRIAMIKKGTESWIRFYIRYMIKLQLFISILRQFEGWKAEWLDPQAFVRKIVCSNPGVT